jgi:2-polyprenyl-3-methyl-5-hydroxy-6-metoxy-1,4-benzoquinol methylase
MQFLAKLYKSFPKGTLRQVWANVHSSNSAPIKNIFSQGKRPRARSEVVEDLRKRFAVYKTSNLKTITAEELSTHINSQIGSIDSRAEGYSSEELEQQRDLSIKFHWGHNHDFGDFRLTGRMGDRHIDLLANFMTLFRISLEDFENKDVLDIGCWTGGTTLLMASLHANVSAIEEVKKYADMASFLAKAFGIDDKVTVQSISLYDCNSDAFHDRFDLVYFPGVIYHLSDPLLALRILFNSLKTGGIILVESAGIDTEEPFCRFDGSLIVGSGTRESMDRGGWNWFMPSPSALYRMMREAGFDEVESLWHRETERLFAYGRKTRQVGICKAGLSVADIK